MQSSPVALKGPRHSCSTSRGAGLIRLGKDRISRRSNRVAILSRCADGHNAEDESCYRTPNAYQAATHFVSDHTAYTARRRAASPDRVVFAYGDLDRLTWFCSIVNRPHSNELSSWQSAVFGTTSLGDPHCHSCVSNLNKPVLGVGQKLSGNRGTT